MRSQTIQVGNHRAVCLEDGRALWDYQDHRHGDYLTGIVTAERLASLGADPTGHVEVIEKELKECPRFHPFTGQPLTAPELEQ